MNTGILSQLQEVIREIKSPGGKLVHMAAKNWGETACGVELFVIGRDPLKTSNRWVDVTCPKCKDDRNK